jgi:Family of unknown function (DUF6090)
MEKNNTGKYIKYAIGEILLVVIGILIALQINILNEARKENIKERALLTNFIQDLRSDSISFKGNFNTLSSINALHRQLYEIGINGRPNEVIKNPNDIRLTLFYNPVAQENDPTIASKISNEKIRLGILNYFRSMQDMDQSNKEFDIIIHDKVREFLRQESAHNLSKWFDNQSMYFAEETIGNIISPKHLISLSKRSEFQQLFFEASIKLTDTLIALKILIDQNEKLISTIEIELAN